MAGLIQGREALACLSFLLRRSMIMIREHVCLSCSNARLCGNRSKAWVFRKSLLLDVDPAILIFL